MSTTEKDIAGTAAEKLLAEIRARFSEFTLFWGDNFAKGDLDVQALGDEGPMASEKVLREAEKRPFVHQDIISQYNRRIKNQSRMNARGHKVDPAGENASTETAERRENRMRQISYGSNAKYARQTALDHAVDRAFGFYMVYTEEADLTSFDQKIIIRPIPNPRSVLIWPYCKQADRSDQEASFVVESYSWDIFGQKWPKAERKSFQSDMLQVAPQWANEKQIQVASYWKREYRKRRLLLLEYGGNRIKLFEDELREKLPDAKVEDDRIIAPNGKAIQIVREALKDFPKVMQYMTNGFQILDRKEWVGSTIPLIMISGPEYYGKDGKLIIESATRKAIAAQMTYDYALMNQLESVGAAPKTKIFFAEGQQDTATDFENLNRTWTAYGTYKRFVDGQDLGEPTIVEFTPHVESMEVLKQSAMVAIENAYGISSVQHQDKVAKSGKALKALGETADITNSHFQDASDRGLHYEGIIINEILEIVEDTDAMRGFRTADDQYSTERITPKEDPQTGEIVEHPYGSSEDHDVVVEAGPDWASQWDKVSDSLDELVQNEAVFPLIADLWIQTKKLGPKGDKMAERFQKALLPASLQEQNAKLDPQMLQAELEKAKALVQQQQQLLQAAEKELKDKTEQKQMELSSKEKMNEENNVTKIAVADIGAKVKENSDVLAVLMQRMEQFFNMQHQGREQSHEAEQAERDRQQSTMQADQQAALQQQQMEQQAQPQA